MNPSPRTILRARTILPLAQPPIDNGAVAIEGNRITHVGPFCEMPASPRSVITDLGEAVLLPGLINAHCHLDYTGMAGQIPFAKNFSDWIKAIIALKAAWGYADFAQSWLKGAAMLLRNGTTTVADIEAVPEMLPEVWSASPLRIISLIELISVKNRFAAGQIVEAAVHKMTDLERCHANVGSLEGPSRTLGLSPHATYSTTAELLQKAAQAAREHHWLLATHVAESEAEFDMFMHQRGPLFEWLHGQRGAPDCPRVSPVEYLERCGYLSENLLAVHGNYLGKDDAALLARRKVSVVHCARSHAYFGHRPFAYGELVGAGVNVCLGTDSLASAPDTPRQPPELNLFAEMRALARDHPELSAGSILRMATINGAAALGRRGELGQLSPGALADLLVLPFAGIINEVEEAVLAHQGPVRASMINGRWAYKT
jgi:cytosine/adenosine deaminase-related metal-dependent hydrolase